ncbi:unnamed protein product [Stenotrophomonas maltophilia]|nr:unnamed protein product [Stenotrophomonas maltophilia]
MAGSQHLRDVLSHWQCHRHRPLVVNVHCEVSARGEIGQPLCSLSHFPFIETSKFWASAQRGKCPLIVGKSRLSKDLHKLAGSFTNALYKLRRPDSERSNKQSNRCPGIVLQRVPTEEYRKNARRIAFDPAEGLFPFEALPAVFVVNCVEVPYRSGIQGLLAAHLVSGPVIDGKALILANESLQEEARQIVLTLRSLQDGGRHRNCGDGVVLHGAIVPTGGPHSIAA